MCVRGKFIAEYKENINLLYFLYYSPLLSFSVSCENQARRHICRRKAACEFFAQKAGRLCIREGRAIMISYTIKND